MAYGSMPYVGIAPPQKMVAILKVHAQNVSVRLVKATMSHIGHYRVLPMAMGPLTLLESIAKVTDQQIVYLLTFFLCP